MWQLRLSATALFVVCVALESGTLVRAQYDVSSCDSLDATFEVITGWMFSANQDILETKPGTLQLAECLQSCRNVRECEAVNFETGLCVLFRTQAGDKADLLIKSQFPVFTMYAQKLCLPSARSCDRSWAFDTVRGHFLKGSEKKQIQMPNRMACLDACIQEREFSCRSAAYDSRTGDCMMSDLDRISYSSSAKLTPEPYMDYVENQCVPEPSKMCEFKKIENRLLKTVDALHEQVANEDDCRQLCLTAPFRCHTFDFDVEGVCRLSHHATATVALVEEPYLTTNGSSWERGACYNVSLECLADHLKATITTNKIFNGKIYSRPRPNACVVDVKNSMTFDIEMEYADPNCGVRQEEPGNFAANLVLQHHDQIMTSSDLGFDIRCSFHLKNQSVAHGIELQVNGRIQSIASESAVVPAPNVTMRITDRLGGDINTAQVGDPLSLRFEIVDQESPYEIFVRELVAMDGSDGAEILLIDSRGCPTDPTIMGSVSQVLNGKTLSAPFEAFKFPTSPVVQFQALLTPCLPSCQPVDCSLPADPSTGGTLSVKSFGRRRKRSWATGGNQSHHESQENLLVANSIIISDRFKFDKDSGKDGIPSRREGGWEGIDGDIGVTSAASTSCTTTLSVLLGGFVLLVLQMIVVVVWLHLWSKRRAAAKYSSEDPSVFSSSASKLHHNLPSSVVGRNDSHSHVSPHFSHKFINHMNDYLPRSS